MDPTRLLDRFEVDALPLLQAGEFIKALELGRQVAVEYRESRFFGDHRVPASVHLV